MSRTAPLYVVGVDASPASAAALRWAVDKAESTHGEVFAVHVYHARTVLPSTRPPQVPAEVPAGAYEQQAALAEARETVARVTSSGRVEVAAVAGVPQQVLIALSRGSDALVLGASHRGGLTGRVLGSTVVHCAVNATCPVMIVPESWLPGSVTLTSGLTRSLT